MSSNNTRQVIKNYIQQEFLFNKPGVSIADNTPLIDEGIIDSLGIFTVISFLQDNMGITVEPDEVLLENFESVEAIAQLVQSKRAD